MDVDEDDDFYGTEEGAKENPEPEKQGEEAQKSDAKPDQDEDGLEEGEEEDEEDSDSDIEIVTESKEGPSTTPGAASTSKYSTIRNIPETTPQSSSKTAKPTVVKRETSAKGASAVAGADLPGIRTSKIDVDAKPIYEPAGKPITQVNIDEDLNENDKPWRRPGTDISDYFNYGFDEFTWALYASKQESLRSEYNQEKVAQNNKKMMEDLNMLMAMGGMPGMPGMGAGAGGAPMPGMDGITPEMQAMMQQMMASGIDPTQMDPAAMFGAMQGSTGTGGAGAQGGIQGQGFGQGAFGQGQNQQLGYGYEQGLEGRNRGGNFGRGRGGRRNW